MLSNAVSALSSSRHLQHETDQRTPLIASLPDSEAFFGAFKRRYGLPPALEDEPEAMAIFEPNLRREMRLLENYRPACGGKAQPITPEPLRIVAVGAKGDERLRRRSVDEEADQELEDHLESWQGYEGSAKLRAVAVAGLAGRHAGDDNASYAVSEFDLFAARIAKADAAAAADSAKESVIRTETSAAEVNSNILRLTYNKDFGKKNQNRMTGAPHRYMLETPDPLISLLQAETELLGFR